MSRQISTSHTHAILAAAAAAGLLGLATSVAAQTTPCEQDPSNPFCGGGGGGATDPKVQRLQERLDRAQERFDNNPAKLERTIEKINDRLARLFSGD